MASMTSVPGADGGKMLIQRVGDALEHTELLSAGGVLLATAEGRRREALVAVELVGTVRKLLPASRTQGSAEGAFVAVRELLVPVLRPRRQRSAAHKSRQTEDDRHTGFDAMKPTSQL